MPRKIFSLQDNEFTLPQFTIWEDGSWYRAYMRFNGFIERYYGGPLFGTPDERMMLDAEG
jgi:hypothetical protein